MRRHWPALLLVIIGTVLVGAGAVRTLTTVNGAGLVTVLAVGALLLVSPFILPRLERVAVSPSGFELQLARDVAGAGAPDAARVLERTDLARFAESYAFVHEDLGGERYRAARVHLQQLLVDRAAALARREKFKAAEVQAMFANGTLAIRVLALGLMQGDPALADGATLQAAIAEPRSANEQYQAMKVVKLRWARLPSQDRSVIRALIESADIEADSSRRDLAAEILALPAS